MGLITDFAIQSPFGVAAILSFLAASLLGLLVFVALIAFR
jgi:hypothetical protein